MSDGIFTVSEDRITELEELNSALEDRVYVLQRDLRQSKLQGEKLQGEKDRLHRELGRALELLEQHGVDP